MTGVLLQRGNVDTGRGTGRSQLYMEAAIGGMLVLVHKPKVVHRSTKVAGGRQKLGERHGILSPSL